MSNSNNYERITREDFEQFLKNRPESWSLVKWSDAHELVYRTAQFAPEDGDFSLYCYSTIDKHTDLARDKGSDAIRLVVVYQDNVHLEYGAKKTLRIDTWRNNLGDKIDNLIQRGKEGVKMCDECGSVMLKREGQYGEFWGCNEYPRCDNTVNV